MLSSTLYGKTAKWPYRTGPFVGLMQILGTMKRMWDWHENAEYAENFFSGEKRQIANSREHFYRNDSSYPGLRQLTGLERAEAGASAANMMCIGNSVFTVTLPAVPGGTEVTIGARQNANVENQNTVSVTTPNVPAA